jgi:hypothetical protein
VIGVLLHALEFDINIGQFEIMMASFFGIDVG